MLEDCASEFLHDKNFGGGSVSLLKFNASRLCLAIWRAKCSHLIFNYSSPLNKII